MQFTIVLSALLSIAGFAMATPPACVINAIGIQGSDATDMTVLCETKQEYVLGNITATCSDMAESAYEYYSSTCLEKAQITVAALPSESESGSSGGDSSGSGSSDNGSSSDNGADSSGDSDDKENAATTVGATPSLIFAVSGLFLTGMTSILFL